MLTPSSIKKLDKLAKRLKSSRSELVEQFARSQDDPSLVAQTQMLEVRARSRPASALPKDASLGREVLLAP
ncbi:MAG: ribbon-helix-helix protein, CopG family [Moorea sp. SIO3I7]|uniref:ribbon-helix-helix protein, CopG family n=1 Tax=unclassified Moorena TaxID=2683338 RepID=UPI0013BF056D|nr:ribbon-helix-helix protein, CopG family [Moorena sp. SIO3I7]NEO04666.1 ribbon-helix-helix protein, CopG family [Moorena sp. SIO3I8]NEP23764.1 ribbon-helix-helix protein, CopG family [Moorena sp. SIO3I6]